MHMLIMCRLKRPKESTPLYNLEELESEEMNFVLFMSHVFNP